MASIDLQKNKTDIMDIFSALVLNERERGKLDVYQKEKLYSRINLHIQKNDQISLHIFE